MKRLVIFILFLIFFFHKSYADASLWKKTPLVSSFIASLRTTPYGLLAGENDSRLWLNPNNGIFISRDLGNSWSELGLKSRGITALAHFEKDIYAATFYSVDQTNGAFVSDDGGKSWTHICNNFSTSTIAANKNYVLVGTFSNGLWRYSKDIESCTQKIGDGFFGPKILALDLYENKVIAATQSVTYLSLDSGSSFQQIAALNSKTISSVAISNDTIIACLNGNQGLYKSTNDGTTWSKINIFANQSCGGLKFANGEFYVSEEVSTNTYSVFRSKDKGESWENTSLNIQNSSGNAKVIEWLFSSPEHLFALIPSQGVYSFEIPVEEISREPFLSLPWNYKSEDELTDKINSFFDHQYPLLGYSQFIEQPEDATSTLNFLGITGKEPDMFYSSHDGIDFDLKYGTPVLAAADGIASYYFCTDCGNTIKITHPNGLQSVYMHLQNLGLITHDASVNVKKGDKIGLVGTTGRTTGPHLHFGVNKISKGYPDGKVDPFGWMSLDQDPWASLSWNDSAGQHSGTSSSYLWNLPIHQSTQYHDLNDTTILVDNKLIKIGKSTSQFNLTVFLKDYARPTLVGIQRQLSYVPHTSFIVEAFDNLNSRIETFDEPIIIEIQLGTDDLINMAVESAKVYFLSDNSSTWEPLPTTYDPSTNKLLATTTHFSRFAVLAELKTIWKKTIWIKKVNFIT